MAVAYSTRWTRCLCFHLMTMISFHWSTNQDNQGQAVAIIRSVAESIENVEKVLILAQDIQQPAVELRSLELTISSGKNVGETTGIFWASGFLALKKGCWMMTLRMWGLHYQHRSNRGGDGEQMFEMLLFFSVWTFVSLGERMRVEKRVEADHLVHGG